MISVLPFYLPLHVLIFSFWLSSNPTNKSWEKDDAVAKVLTELGSDSHLKKSGLLNKELAEIGEDLIKNGFTKKRKGSKTISVYYQCTSCHNLVQEDPILHQPEPEARLAYSEKENIPFLQATTFWGIVNRESWYNGDYVKKYGKLVEKAKYDIEEAIQLCAQECAQGRKLQQWEVDAIMAYYWELELKLGDINLSEKELEIINKASSNSEKEQAIKMLKNKYMLASPATFSDAPKDKAKGYTIVNKDPINGKLIYENSCLYCHDKNGVTEYELDNTQLSFKKLIRDIRKDQPLSFYQAIRYGTSAQPGYRPYMPHYTLERMSDQQVEDLRAYIESRAQ